MRDETLKPSHSRRQPAFFAALAPYLGGKRRLAPLLLAVLQGFLPRERWRDSLFLDPYFLAMRLVFGKPRAEPSAPPAWRQTIQRGRKLEMDEEQSRPDGTELESEDASPNIVDLAAILAERLGIPHRALPVRDSGVWRIDVGPIIGTDGAVPESAGAAQFVEPHDRGALSTRAGARRTSQDAGMHCADCGRLALAGGLTLGELHVGRERQLNARRVEMLDSWPLRVYCESCADERDLSRIAIALRSALATHGPEPPVAVPGDEQGPSYSCPHEVALGTPYTSISVRYELVERPQLELGPEDAVWVMPITMLESWAVSYCEPCASWIDFDRVEIPRRPRDGDGVGSRQPAGHPGQPEAGRDPALPVPSDTASEVSDA